MIKIDIDTYDSILNSLDKIRITMYNYVCKYDIRSDCKQSDDTKIESYMQTLDVLNAFRNNFVVEHNKSKKEN